MKVHLIFCILICFAIQKKKVVQNISLKGDHFFSEKTRTHTYVLENLQVGKSLVVYLKRKNQQNTQQLQNNISNPVTIQITDKQGQEKTCQFTSYTNTCLLDQVKSKSDTKLKVSCQKTPCDVRFKSLQGQKIIPAYDQITPAQTFYSVKDNDIIMELSCNNPQITQFSQKVKLYSNAKYSILNEGNILVYIFTGKVQDIVVKQSTEVQSCTRIKFSSNKNQTRIKQIQLALVNKQKQIKVNKIPQQQLRIDLMVTQFYNKNLQKFNITFYGFKGNQTKKQIDKFQMEQFQSSRSSDLDIIVKNKKFAGFDAYSFKITTNQTLFIRYQLEDVYVHSLDIQEESYFNIEKGQAVQYDIIRTNPKQKVKAVLLDQSLKEKVYVNLTCEPQAEKCKLLVSGNDSAKVGIAVIYEREKSAEEQYIPLDDRIQMNLKEGETKYFINKNQKSQGRLVSVSSGNVLVYAAGEKCPRPSSQCFQYAANAGKTMIIEQYNGPLYIAVEALELTSFTLRVNSNDANIELIEGVPQTINMQNGNQVIFKFRLTQKEATNFNLIAAPGAFQMYITNSEQQPDVQDLDLISSTDYIRFNKKQIDQLVFTILIKRKLAKKNQHFTIIASTKSSIMLLQRTTPHYDLFKQNQVNKYALLMTKQEIQKKEGLILSLNVFQKLSHVNFTIKLGKSIEELDKQIQISRGKVNIDIHQFTEDICQQEMDEDSTSDVCALYFQMTSHNTKQVDVTLTVLKQNSIIQLTSGVWQSYQLSDLTGSSHFFFIPTTKKNPIYLLFSHSFGAFKLNHVLFNNSQQIKNPGLWPFPGANQQLRQRSANGFQIHEDTISTEQIQKCYPNCILLISLQNAVPQKSISPNVFESMQNTFGTYSIMATDSVVEIIQGQKMPVSLLKDQSKIFTIPLTQYLTLNKTLTFLFSDVIGFHRIYGELTTNRLENIPQDSEFDFKFEGYETQITTQQIIQKLKAKNLDSHEQIDLLIYSTCNEHCKFIFQFTTRQTYTQQLYFGLPTNVNLAPNSQKIYSVSYYADYKIKFTRIRGFPYVTHITCKLDELAECYQSLNALSEPPILSKSQQLNIKHEFGTMVLLKIQSKNQNVEVEIVAISNTGTIQLKEGVTMTDFLQVNSTSLYKISTVEDQDTIITINIFEGNPTVTMRDLRRNINKTKTKKGNSIQFHVYNDKSFAQIKQQQLQKQKQNQQNKTNPSANIMARHINTFSSVVLQISDQTFNCSYSIVYTIGERHIDLIDGLLSSTSIPQGETVTYNYMNTINSTAIATISFENAQMMNNCQITLLSYTLEQEEEPTQQKLQRLKMNLKTPKPSITFNLDPQFKGYEIKLKNKKDKIIKSMITINHMDLIYLPFDYEYPNYLQKKENTYYIVEVMNKGYVQVVIKKCSDSDLTFSYAIHDESFLNQSYAYTQQIQEHRYNTIIKAESSTIYFKLQSEQGVLYSINVFKFDNKKQTLKDQTKPGDKGEMTFNIISSTKADITFTPVVCKKQCNKINYYYLIGTDRDQINSQISCPSSFFSLSATPNRVLTPLPIKYTKQDTKYKFSVDLPDGTSYVGVKAIQDGKEIVYRVIQLQTFWAGVANNRSYHIGILSLLLFCFAFILCLIWRRRLRMKQRYDNLPDIQS